MMAFIGVLISWLILAKNRDLDWLACSATCLAWASAASMVRCSLMSRTVPWITGLPWMSKLVSKTSEANSVPSRRQCCQSNRWLPFLNAVANR